MGRPRFGMIRRTFAMLAVAVLCALAIGTATAPEARAHHPWVHAGKWVHMHTRDFPVYREGLSLWAMSAANAEFLWSHNTDLNVFYTGIHSWSRLHIIPGGYGDTGWVGLTTVEGPWDSSTGHYHHSHNLYNWYYSSASLYSFQLACHEMGHSLGLAHNWESNSCMRAHLGQGWPIPNSHDREQLRSLYATFGH